VADQDGATATEGDGGEGLEGAAVVREGRASEGRLGKEAWRQSRMEVQPQKGGVEKKGQ
jgi:hypothetical protein